MLTKEQWETWHTWNWFVVWFQWLVENDPDIPLVVRQIKPTEAVDVVVGD